MSKHEKQSDKDFYAIKHGYDVDGGFGDAVTVSNLVGVVFASKEEIDKFLKKWDKPEVYDRPYADLYHHCVSANKLEIAELDTLVPYRTFD